ncbi:hypothetical protein Tco_1434293 [Tanacetum coccineum]
MRTSVHCLLMKFAIGDCCLRFHFWDNLCAYDCYVNDMPRVETLRALVRAGDQTSEDARSGYMLSGDAKSWVVRIYLLSYSTIVQLIKDIGTTTGF